jgi:hypothetical protein
MPSKSKAQHNLMAAVANNPAFAKKVGISKSVGEEFMKADKSKKFGSGNTLKTKDASENPGLSKLPTEVRNKMGYMKKGGMAMKKGGMHKMPDGKMMKDSDMPKKKMNMGGMAYKEGGKADMAQDKAMIKKAFKQHDMQEHKGGKGTKLALKKGGMAKKMTKGCGYASGGKVAQLSKANGVATKGKTKGTMIAMRSGGKTKSKMC